MNEGSLQTWQLKKYNKDSLSPDNYARRCQGSLLIIKDMNSAPEASSHKHNGCYYLISIFVIQHFFDILEIKETLNELLLCLYRRICV